MSDTMVFGVSKNCLQHLALPDSSSRGRRETGEEDDDRCYYDVITPFRLDQHKLSNSKAYRRLKDKTQVFSFPENPHVRTRLSHTNEVRTNAATIAEILGLNISLCEAIATGHDIGHTPYGHIGEEFISGVTGTKFRHDILSVIIAQKIERLGKGLNLSFETLQGILCHSKGNKALDIDTDLPLEYAVVMYSDKIAYTVSDINDSVRNEYVSLDELPSQISDLGCNQRTRVENCIKALAQESTEKGMVSFSESDIAQKFEYIRQWMYDNVYHQIDWSFHKMVLEKIYTFFRDEPFFEGCDPALLLALLTDREANKMADIFLITKKPSIKQIEHFGIMEILCSIKGKSIDLTNPDLEW